MAARAAAAGASLPVRRLLGKTWPLRILAQLERAPRRFNELKTLIPSITSRSLAAGLRELERIGVVERRALESPRRWEARYASYALTPRGGDLLKALRPLREWEMKWGG